MQRSFNRYVLAAVVGLGGFASAAHAAGAFESLVFDGWLNRGETARHSVFLLRGSVFQADGTCDADCRDLDLVLRNSDGQVVAEDRDRDDVPIIRYDVRRSGSYRLEVVMYRCSANPCRYDVDVER